VELWDLAVVPWRWAGVSADSTGVVLTGVVLAIFCPVACAGVTPGGKLFEDCGFAQLGGTRKLRRWVGGWAGFTSVALAVFCPAACAVLALGGELFEDCGFAQLGGTRKLRRWVGGWADFTSVARAVFCPVACAVLALGGDLFKDCGFAPFGGTPKPNTRAAKSRSRVACILRVR
jgi:hypothetical protein